MRAYSPLPQPDGTLIQDPDFSLPSKAGSVPWRLFHYSDIPHVDGPFGYGRRASWPLRLCADITSGGPSTVTLEREEGHSVRYYRSGPTHPFTTLSQRVFDDFVQEGDGSWTETRFDTGAKFRYPAGSFSSLTYYETALGQRVTLGYDGQQRMTSLTDPIGRQIAYSYGSGNHVSQVTDWASRTHLFGYAPEGDLQTWKSPAGGVTTFAHDSDHRLTQITDPDGFRTSYTYDDDNRVLSRSIDGNLSRYAYAGSSQTAYTDPLGGAWLTTLDAYGNVIQTIDPAGAVRAASYSSVGLPLATVDAIGRRTTHSYNSKGRELTLQDPTGAIFTKTYDSYGNLVTDQLPLPQGPTTLLLL